ncbi:MAG TPA: ABC transporter permease subunit [Ktedonobacterales bacterium]|nr:ABC transporter permease subunit [Ktedonobacterales bacterium]
MSTATLTSARKSTQAIERPHPLLSVLTWELRRLLASRLFWIQALCFFVLVLFVIWVGREPDQFGFNTFNGFVAGTSAWGLLHILPTGLLVLLALLLPFVAADSVTRDLQRRTHELLMTTALPTWAYVWGRYLIGLLVSLGLAVLLLFAILLMGLLLHLTVPNYPAPEIGNVLILWGGMVVPATILVSSVSFALGTLFPRLSLLIKIGMLVVWFVGAIMLPAGLGDQTAPPAWYSAWDPTSAATAKGMLFQNTIDFQNLTANPTGAAQFQTAILTIENRLSDLGAWLAPHLILACLSLLLVVLAAFTFQRFRNTFGA